MGFEHEKPCRFEVTGISIFDFVARSIHQLASRTPTILAVSRSRRIPQPNLYRRVAETIIIACSFCFLRFPSCC
jgi:hypothetical protein